MNYFITSDNIKIYYSIEGKGTPILFVHGFTATHDVFRVSQKILSKYNMVISYDLRGHGLSVGSNQEITIELLASDLKEFIDKLNLDNIVLVGWSLGGSIIFEYIKQFGLYRISNICLIDTSPRVINDVSWSLGLYHGDYNMQDAKMDLDIMQKSWSDFAIKFIKSFSINLNENQLKFAYDRIKNNNQIRMFEIWKSLINKDYRNVLENINAPTLIIFGGKSNLYSTEVGHYLNRRIKNSTLIIFENNSHLLLQENPTRISRVLRDFILNKW